MKNLLGKIEDKSVKIGVIGQGYVGLPLSLTFAKKFFVVGYDTKDKTIEKLKLGQSTILDIPDITLTHYLNNTYFPSKNPDDLKQCDFLIICVPCLLYTSPSPRDRQKSRMPSSA